MKKLNILLLALGAVALSSCDTYLDKLPDDRAEVNTYEKANLLLATAYADVSPNYLMEISSDNITDNGKAYGATQSEDMAYRWQDVTTTENDDPRSVWNETYKAAATANQVLDALPKITDKDTKDLQAEALLCRAYNIFRLSNTFCMAYDPTKAKEYLGLPYPKQAGVSVDTRGTLEELYANIDADIEAALPNVSDSHLTAPKYHFNRRAAYAFAARFNLYYHKYDKAIKYATEALGSAPAAMLRNVAAYRSFSNPSDIKAQYIRSDENANLMLRPAVSSLGIWFISDMYRFGHNFTILNYETFRADQPWGRRALQEANLLFGSTEFARYPKLDYQIEWKDKAAGTGWYRIVDAVFTADETLLVRAEAQALKGEFDQAVADINLYLGAHAVPGTAPQTKESINAFMDKQKSVPALLKNDNDRGIKKPLHPQGFTVAEGTMTNLIHAILQLRRIETYMQGLRFQDIKRYGLEICHMVDGEPTLQFKAGDQRGAIQLPQDVTTKGLENGLEPNPRN